MGRVLERKYLADGDMSWRAEPVTPPQLQKVLKAKDIDYRDFVGDNVQTISSGTTLAAESDKRPAVIPGGALQALADKLK